MKLKPKIYAQALVSVILSESEESIAQVAKRFWQTLQKNKQYKDLPKILDALDEVYAEKHGQTLVKIYSEVLLTEGDLKEIESKLTKKISGELLIKNILAKNAGPNGAPFGSGITIESGGKILDLSIDGKISKLKKLLSN